MSDVPFRREFDQARNPLTARNKLGITPVNIGAQPVDAELTAIAGLTSAADQLPYFTGSGTAALTTLTSAARSVLDDTTTGAMLTTLGAASSAAFPAGAWNTWSPTVSSSGGAITSSTVNLARYNTAGKTVTAFYDVSITNQGTGTGFLLVSSPVTGHASTAGLSMGREIAATGAACVGAVTTTDSLLAKYDGTTLVITGYRVIALVVYEAA